MSAVAAAAELLGGPVLLDVVDRIGGLRPKWWAKHSTTERYTDGTAETLRAGDAYDIRPGHNAHVEEDVDLVEFTRADDTPGINTIET